MVRLYIPSESFGVFKTAAKAGSSELCRLLLEHGAHLTDQSELLQYAFESRDLKTIYFFVEQGGIVDKELQDKYPKIYADLIKHISKVEIQKNTTLLRQKKSPCLPEHLTFFISGMTATKGAQTQTEAEKISKKQYELENKVLKKN